MVLCLERITSGEARVIFASDKRGYVLCVETQIARPIMPPSTKSGWKLRKSRVPPVEQQTLLR